MALFKFQSISKTFRYSSKHKDFIDKMPLSYSDGWDGKLFDLIEKGTVPKNAVKIRDEIKSTIKEKLIKIQGSFCIYCGIHFDIVGTPQRDHIASKSKYPRFTFVAKNIALACQYCNGFEKKSNKDIVAKVHKVYRKCEFSIVHPYFDNIDDHIQFSFDGADVLISPKGGSLKGRNTIKIFGLDKAKQAELRGAVYLRQKHLEKLSKDKIKLGRAIVLRKYSI